MPGRRRSGPTQGRCGRCGSTEAGVAVLVRKTATAYVGVRVFRLIQTRSGLPGEGGLSVGGVHIHHYVWGFALLLGQLGVRGGRCVHQPLRSNLGAVGAALILEELDVLTGAEGWLAGRVMRYALHGAAVLGTADGLRFWRSTWSGVHRATG